MTPEEVLADLRDRAPRLAHLADRRGDPLDLSAALLPDADERVVIAATQGVAADAARVAGLADVHAVPGPERARRLAFVAALAHTSRHLPRVTRREYSRALGRMDPPRPERVGVVPFVVAVPGGTDGCIYEAVAETAAAYDASIVAVGRAEEEAIAAERIAWIPHRVG